MALPKQAGTWTYEDLSSLPNDGRRYEIIEGELYQMPSPGAAHALAVIQLIAALMPLVAELDGQLATAPIDVFFPGANPVQPDILLMLSGGPARIVPRGIEGAPDLIIEVLSSSNRGHDLLTKRSLYARAGVREYWIVDPEARTIDILGLDRDAFHQVTVASGSDMPVSPLLGPRPLAPGNLFPEVDA